MTNNQPKATILKDTRLAKGLSIDLVHEATKIPLDALRAIEEGYKVKMLTPFYYKGFIKIYAEFLGLDVKEVFVIYGLDRPVSKLGQPTTAQAAASSPANSKVEKVEAKPKTKTNIQIPALPLKGIKEGFKKIATKENIWLMARVVIFVITVWFLIKLGGCCFKGLQSWIKSWPKKNTAVAVKKERKKAAEPVKEPVLVNREKEDSKEEVKSDTVRSAVSTNASVSLAIRASRDSWVQVKADDKVVFQMTMKKGTMESFSAKNTIELTGKNINELEMEVNGRHIGALGSSERKARKVMITKDGLSVKK